MKFMMSRDKNAKAGTAGVIVAEFIDRDKYLAKLASSNPTRNYGLKNDEHELK